MSILVLKLSLNCSFINCHITSSTFLTIIIMPIFNISSTLKDSAKRLPYKHAVVFPSKIDKNGTVLYSHLTFKQLDQKSDDLARGLEKAGITRGTRTTLMVRPSLVFFSLIFALFKVGAIPVVVDPGMGLKRMLSCFKEGKPEAFIGIPLAHLMRTLYPSFFKTVKTFVTVGKRYLWGGLTINDLYISSDQPYNICNTLQNETAAILFTTGSTGPAKGVVYTHGNFGAQIDQIKAHFKITPDEIDLPTFPLFALFDPALGMTAVIPDMDPTKPALVNSKKIIEAIENYGVTNMFASPALLNRVGLYGEKNNILLPSLKRVISAGAPVSHDNIERFSKMLTGKTEIHTPYGATEAVPIISIGSDEILNETKQQTKIGAGTCIGYPINNIDVNIIKITDNPISEFSENLYLSNGEIGEIVVKGKLVTKHYFENHKANSFAKIKYNDDFIHRMGDLAWKDDKGRFWFCGRKSHRVITEKKTMFTIPCEAIFNNHQDVFRSALVGIGQSGKQIPVICIETKVKLNRYHKQKLKKELFELGAKNKNTKDIKIILFKKQFPVDIRHNSKIFREQLSIWAEKHYRPSHK